MTEKSRPVAIVGGSSLLVIFTVLCLAVFALLSLSTAQANARLADTSARAVEDYYAADTAAEERYALLRGGVTPEDVLCFPSFDGDHFYYTVPIDDNQELQVELLQSDSGDWTVLQWQAVSTAEWEPNTDLPVWDGEILDLGRN